MKNAFRKTGLALALAATTLALSSPAAARDGDYYDRGNNDAALAIGAGILGLVVGAAIASDNDRRYDDRHYYQDRRYYPRNYRYDNRRYHNRRHDRYRDYRNYRNYRGDHYNRGRRGYYRY